MGYLIPRLFNRDDLSLRINGLVDRSRDVLTFTADRKEASVSVEKRFSASTLLIGQYSFRRVEALDISSKISAAGDSPAQPAGAGGNDRGELCRGSPRRSRRTRRAASTRWSNAGVSWTGLWIAGKLPALHRPELHLLCLGLASGFCAQDAVRRGVSLWKPVQHHRPGQQRPARRRSSSRIRFPCRNASSWGAANPCADFPSIRPAPATRRPAIPSAATRFSSTLSNCERSFAQRRLGLVLFEDAGNVYSSIRRMRLAQVHAELRLRTLITPPMRWAWAFATKPRWGRSGSTWVTI